MVAKHGLPHSEDLGHLKIKHGGQCLLQFITT